MSARGADALWLSWLLVASYSLQVYASCSSPTYAQPPRGQPPPPIRFAGGKVTNAESGEPVAIKAINWFGFNNGQGAVDGLWAGGSDVATDFLEVLRQLQLLGFNAIRLPFRFSDLRAPAPDRTRHCRPSPEWQFKRHITDPRYHPTSKPLPPAPLAIARPGGAKACNSYLPTGSGLDRLLWTTQVINAHGMYVILDYHGSSGSSLETDAISKADTFATRWSEVWRAVSCLPRFQQDLAGRVLADILNEPDMLNLKWGPIQGLLTANPNWGTLALAAMDRIAMVSPGDALFLVSGTDQTKFGLNWGNGFVTDPSVIRDYQIGDPNPFFRQLVERPYASRVAISPHAYPPSITGATYLGRTLWSQLATSFGYLQTRGYCPQGAGGASVVRAASLEAGPAEAPAAGAGGAVEAAGVGGALAAAAAASHNSSVVAGTNTPGAAAAVAPSAAAATPLAAPPSAANASGAAAAPRPSRRALLAAASAGCFKFPIVVSEFGSNFEQASDVAWLDDFAAWVAQQSKEAGPVGWAWWAVNANSGDTGGLVTPSWQSVMWVKVRYLVDKMGLRPWYLGA